jgi:hypothetical protein
MKCARCGYIRQTNDDHFIPESECPSCGIIYDKIAETISDTFSAEAEVPVPPVRTSPVDAESLKKARERVDNRLKERLAEQKGDLRRDQTLEMARQLAIEGVRRRKEQWEQQQAALRENDDSRIEPASYSEALEANDSDADADATAATADDAEADGAKGDSDTLPISDREAETEESSPISELASCRQEAEQAPSDAAAGPEPIPDDDPPQANASQERSGAGHQLRQWFLGGGMAQLLPLAAWLILAVGIGGTAISWMTLAHAEAAIEPRTIWGANSTSLGLLLGVAYLVTGVLGFAFFWVSSLICRQLKDIHRLLLLQPISRSDIPAEQPAAASEGAQ